MRPDLLRPGLLREAIVAVERGASVTQAARQFGLRPSELFDAMQPGSEARTFLREARQYLQDEDTRGRSVIGGY